MAAVSSDWICNLEPDNVNPLVLRSEASLSRPDGPVHAPTQPIEVEEGGGRSRGGEDQRDDEQSV